MSNDTLVERAPRAWIAPLISTLVTLPACFIAYLIGGLSLALVLLFVSWALPWEQRYMARRAIFALAAPLMVPFAYVAFAALVDWP